MMGSNEPRIEPGGAFWKKIYLAVVITTVAVIAALWAFSRYFA